MPDLVDKRGGAYDPINEFGKPRPPQVREAATPHQKAQWGADVRPEPLPGPDEDRTRFLRDYGKSEWVR